MFFDFFAFLLNLEQDALIILECCSKGRKRASGEKNVAFLLHPLMKTSLMEAAALK